jgi:peroxiredoxin
MTRFQRLAFATSASLTVSLTTVGFSQLPEARAAGGPAPPQAKAEAPKGVANDNLKAINEDFDRDLTAIEKKRLGRLEQLAASQSKDEANATYEMYFQFAIGSNLFKEAEPVAERVIKAGGASPQVSLLAHIVNIIGEADRGAFQESLESLTAAYDAKDQAKGAATRQLLPVTSRLSLLEAYYQRLVQGEQFDIARRAFRIVHDGADDTTIKAFAAARLARLEMVGKPAPPIDGTSVDGKPIRLSDNKGEVTLVAFWATWCIPSAEELAWVQRVYNDYHTRGFRILGVNLDTASEATKGSAAVLPNVRRFLIDHNVPWPNVINGAGAQDFAKAYGVAEIPANVLVGRDGNIIELDLARSNLEKAVARALGR